MCRCILYRCIGVTIWRKLVHEGESQVEKGGEGVPRVQGGCQSTRPAALASIVMLVIISRARKHKYCRYPELGAYTTPLGDAGKVRNGTRLCQGDRSSLRGRSSMFAVSRAQNRRISSTMLCIMTAATIILSSCLMTFPRSKPRASFDDTAITSSRSSCPYSLPQTRNFAPH